MSIPFVPTNTRRNDWAYNNFLVWRKHRNMSFPDDLCPIDLIESPPWDTTAMARLSTLFNIQNLPPVLSKTKLLTNIPNPFLEIDKPLKEPIGNIAPTVKSLSTVVLSISFLNKLNVPITS